MFGLRVCVSVFANVFFDYPVICHQTVSLQLFDLHFYDFYCRLIIIDFSTVLWHSSSKTRKTF